MTEKKQVLRLEMGYAFVVFNSKPKKIRFTEREMEVLLAIRELGGKHFSAIDLCESIERPVVSVSKQLGTLTKKGIITTVQKKGVKHPLFGDGRHKRINLYAPTPLLMEGVV